MKFTFYLEFGYPEYKQDKTPHLGRCIAIFSSYHKEFDSEYNKDWKRGLISDYPYPNGPASRKWIKKSHIKEKCLRIPAKRAYEIHPELFKHPLICEMGVKLAEAKLKKLKKENKKSDIVKGGKLSKKDMKNLLDFVQNA